MLRRAGIIFFLMIAFGAAAGAGDIVLAQQSARGPGQGQPPSASSIVAMMKDNLNLTDEQVGRITPIIESEIQQMENLRSQGADHSSARTQMEALRASTESKLAQYLTAEQLTKWKNNRPQPRSGSEGGQPGNEPPPGENN